MTKRSKHILWPTVILLSAISLGCADSTIERQLRLLQSVPFDLNHDGMLIYDRGGKGEDYFSEKGKMTLVVYSGPDECSPCNLKTMSQWYELQDSINRLYGSVVKYNFIFSPQNSQMEELEYNLQETICGHPLMIDTAGYFLKRNPNIPKNPTTHTFLLDSCDNVILVGSPVKNPQIRSLLFRALDSYLQKIEDAECHNKI